jgi:hypothetical protein
MNKPSFKGFMLRWKNTVGVPKTSKRSDFKTLTLSRSTDVHYPDITGLYLLSLSSVINFSARASSITQSMPLLSPSPNRFVFEMVKERERNTNLFGEGDNKGID